MTSTALAEDPVLEREAFLAERRTYIGASEVAAVLGLDPNKTRLELYNEKVGLTEPFAGNKHTQRGQKLEDTAAREYMEVTGKTVRRDRRALTHPVYPFFRGHVDRREVGTKRITEIKCPSRGMFYKVQREGLQNSWIMQGQAYMLLDGSKFLNWCVFCADAWECVPFEQPFDPEIAAFIEKQVVEFWVENVQARVPPKPTKLDNEIATLSQQIGGDLIRRTDQEFIDSAQLLREAAALKSDGEMLYDLAKQRCIDAVNGEVGRYEGGGLRLYYMEQAGRKSLDKRALQAEYPDINLAQFEKQGAPFKTFRPYFIGGE